jgi:hypothetical protein
MPEGCRGELPDRAARRNDVARAFEIMAVGETSIVWLGQDDAVVIGQQLVVPGVRNAHLEGDLAW